MITDKYPPLHPTWWGCKDSYDQENQFSTTSSEYLMSIKGEQDLQQKTGILNGLHSLFFFPFLAFNYCILEQVGIWMGLQSVENLLQSTRYVFCNASFTNSQYKMLSNLLPLRQDCHIAFITNTTDDCLW